MGASEAVSVTIVMPAFNEAQGIPEFLQEIHESFVDFEHSIFVVNDCSTDETESVLMGLSEQFPYIRFRTNDSNVGHGPSTLRALQFGLDSGSDVVLAVDGDGQFTGEGMREALVVFLADEPDVLEGVRVSREDPLYRKVVTLITRLLVWSRCGVMPRDANTPLRIYSSETLASLLPSVPESSPIPNLVISAVTRASRQNVLEFRVRSIPRRGVDPRGSTWGKSIRSLPSRRFLSFCAAASKSWLRTPIKQDK